MVVILENDDGILDGSILFLETPKRFLNNDFKRVKVVFRV